MQRSQLKSLSRSSRRLFSSETRVSIVGGGLIGSSVAYWLSHLASISKRKLDITVFERDPSYKHASSSLAVGGIRHQFSTLENLQMGQFATHFVRNIGSYLSVNGEAPSLSFHEGGYMYLASEQGRQTLEENVKMQADAGSKIVLLSPKQINEKFPWINTEGISIASLGVEGEGWIDPYSLLMAFKRKAQSQGVKYVTAPVVGVTLGPNAKVEAIRIRGNSGDQEVVPTDILVNAAGPKAADIGNMVGMSIPVRPRKRSVFQFDYQGARITNSPLVICPNGVYWRPEGNSFLTGCCPPADNDAEDFEVADALWEEQIWETIAHRVPTFEAAKVISCWAGHYEFNTFDHNAIIGEHPDVRGFILANGFSGHGMMQSPAAGRGVAELILEGKFVTLDLTRFSPKRFDNNQPIIEKNVI